MPDCDNNCSSCVVEGCPSRQQTDFRVAANPLSDVKKLIAIVSGKGGVGKSLTTSILAVNAKRDGKKVAIIDADITGPSIPKAFGLHTMARASETTIFPVMTKEGIETMSLNLLTEDETSPVIWRGPVISGLIKQFWSDVAYGEIDECFIDMPPGTGDVPLTVFQSLPIDGIIIVTSPQDLVDLIVEKAVNMAKMMNIPVLGVVENMSSYICPCCGKELHPFGEPSLAVAKKFGIELTDSLPIDSKLAHLVDEGKIEEYEGRYLDKITQAIHAL